MLKVYNMTVAIDAVLVILMLSGNVVTSDVGDISDLYDDLRW